MAAPGNARRTIPTHPTPERPVAPARTLTRGQIMAIRAVMHLFLEDNLAAGWQRTAPRWCDHCRAARSSAGFIPYEGGCLCNTCATAFELARARGPVQTAGQFLIC